MIFAEAALSGVWLITPELREDVRGLFARTWCEREARAAGLDERWVQSSLSYTKTRGTLRGLHFQRAPYEEVKLVRCTAGAIFDVVVDLRRESPTFKRHIAVELTAENRLQLYIPRGCAHGYQTLADGVEVLYQMSEVYSPDHADGVRWDDPAFGISWPGANPIMNERDRRYPDFAG
jgi:dTDP-4-dehydrorhamnose 3,5-epimerase